MVNHGKRTLSKEGLFFAQRIGGIPDLQHCHPEHKPEVLLVKYAKTIGVPWMGGEVITIAEHNENPSCVDKVREGLERPGKYILESNPTL